MNSTTSTPSSTDGRRARGQANRRKIVAAMVELVRERSVTPTAEQVAVRAEVALRTVFRHFADMESLYREITTEVMQLITPLLSLPFHSSHWRGRLEEMLQRRSDLFEAILPFRIATDALRQHSPFLQENHEQMQQLQEQMLRRILPEHVLADRPLLAALNLLLSISAWQQLRHDQRLDAQTARQSISRAVAQLTRNCAD